MTDARILVVGSPSWDDVQLLADVLLDTWHDATQLGYDSITVVHRDAEGADALADLWARGNGLDVEVHQADEAGQRMVDAGAELVVAFQRAGSRGTADAMARATKAGLPVRHITA